MYCRDPLARKDLFCQQTERACSGVQEFDGLLLPRGPKPNRVSQGFSFRPTFGLTSLNSLHTERFGSY